MNMTEKEMSSLKAQIRLELELEIQEKMNLEAGITTINRGRYYAIRDKLAQMATPYIGIYCSYTLCELVRNVTKKLFGVKEIRKLSQEQINLFADVYAEFSDVIMKFFTAYPNKDYPNRDIAQAIEEDTHE